MIKDKSGQSATLYFVLRYQGFKTRKRHEKVARNGGFRMFLGLRECAARSNPQVPSLLCEQCSIRIWKEQVNECQKEMCMKPRQNRF